MPKINEKKKNKLRLRDKYIAFWVTEQERELITKHAEDKNQTISEFLRKRAFRPEMSNNELADFIIGFIAKKLEEGNKTSTNWNKKRKIKPKLNLDINTAEMTEEQKSKYNKSKNVIIDHSNAMIEELKTVLESRKQF